MQVINVAEIAAADWRFLEPDFADRGFDWRFHRAAPVNIIERIITRPNLARYRAALSGALSARGAASSVLISHLPRSAAATNICRRALAPKTPQIAFSFNFTDRPAGAALRYFRGALEGIDEFVVFSELERTLYPELFRLPAERFRKLPWVMDRPTAGPSSPMTGAGEYYCAIGGEGRDYALLAEVMRSLPEMRMAIVARPYSIANIDFPDNVSLFTNLPSAETWRLAADSLGLVVPLKTTDTACGHITLIGAQLWGTPLITTRSTGIAEYVDAENALLVEPGEAESLRAALLALGHDRGGALMRAEAAQKLTQQRNHKSHWIKYFDAMFERYS